MNKKEKRNDTILISIIIGVVLYSILQYILIHVV
jgi:hypothetical protein